MSQIYLSQLLFVWCSRNLHGGFEYHIKGFLNAQLELLFINESL